MNAAEEGAHYQRCYRDEWGIVRREEVRFLTPEEHAEQVSQLRFLQAGWLERVDSPPDERTAEQRRTKRILSLRHQQTELSRQLAEVTRQLDALEAI